MEEKASIIIAKRTKKRVNGKINKEKVKKNVTPIGKYIRNASANKNTSKKTYLYTLFKSFIKPYNERDTAFYSILCIINNIYKCRYYSEHRCLICKTNCEENENAEQKDNDSMILNSEEYTESNLFGNVYNDFTYDTFSNSISFNYRCNRNFHLIKNNCLNSEKTEITILERDSATTSIISNVKPVGKSGSGSSSSINYYNNNNNNNTNINKDNTTDIIDDKKEGGVSTNRTTDVDTAVVSYRPRIVSQSVYSQFTSQFVGSKLHLSSNNECHFLSHEKLVPADIYNFDIFNKINAYDKILLDLNQSEIHPYILRTGIFFNKHSQTTHNHRNVDLLIALKNFIQDYTLPPYEPINKHMKIAIDKEINYIIMCKKHSVSMGEVIRWFKCTVSKHVGKGVLEETKGIIIKKINNYIRTKIITPSIFISNFTSENIIQNNDVIVIYTFDYVVYLSILKAVKKGKKFEIVLVDSEPFKNTTNVKLYTKLGLTVTYTLISGLSYYIRRCTKIILGIDAVIHNSVYADVGTSIICMIANIFNVEAYIICETYKISNKIIVDSFNMNNINNNLDIYDYIYLHHYQHAKTGSFSKDLKKTVDTSNNFSKRLNEFMDSFTELNTNNILFSPTRPCNKPVLRYARDLKRNRRKKQMEKEQNNMKRRDEMKNEKREEGLGNEFVKPGEKKCETDEGITGFCQNTSLLGKNSTLKNEKHPQTKGNFNGYSILEAKEMKKETVIMQHNYISRSPVEGKKNLEEKKDSSGKKEWSHLLQGGSPNKNAPKKSFFNLKNEKNASPEMKFGLLFKNHFDSKINSTKGVNEHNDNVEKPFYCNSVCHSICSNIGDVNIKNVCTDKYNETNLFSSVVSHINKINSNSDKSFYVANICNDITPLKYINYIITEVGMYRSVNKNALNVFVQNV